MVNLPEIDLKRIAVWLGIWFGATLVLSIIMYFTGGGITAIGTIFFWSFIALVIGIPLGIISKSKF